MSPNQPMSVEQALQLIDQVCARFQGTREDYLTLQTAVAVLRDSITLRTDSQTGAVDLSTEGQDPSLQGHEDLQHSWQPRCRCRTNDTLRIPGDHVRASRGRG